MTSKLAPALVLPRLPSPAELRGWLTRQSPINGEANARYNLGSSWVGDDETCPVLAYMKSQYGFADAEADGWSVVKCKGYGVTLVFDTDGDPRAAGLMKSLKIVNETLDELLGDGYDGLTRSELLVALDSWENPHDAAHTIAHDRALAGGPPRATPA